MNSQQPAECQSLFQFGTCLNASCNDTHVELTSEEKTRREVDGQDWESAWESISSGIKRNWTSIAIELRYKLRAYHIARVRLARERTRLHDLTNPDTTHFNTILKFIKESFTSEEKTVLATLDTRHANVSHDVAPDNVSHDVVPDNVSIEDLTDFTQTDLVAEEMGHYKTSRFLSRRFGTERELDVDLEGFMTVRRHLSIPWRQDVHVLPPSLQHETLKRKYFARQTFAASFHAWKRLKPL